MNLKSQQVKTIASFAAVIAAALLVALLGVKVGIMVAAGLFGCAVVVAIAFKIAKDIRWGFYLLMAANFFSVGLTRYVSLPLGLTIDIILLLLFFIFFIKEFKNISWKPLANPVFIAVTVWMLINILELANPEARSFEAWFYAMRGVALYFFLALRLATYACITKKI